MLTFLPSRFLLACLLLCFALPSRPATAQTAPQFDLALRVLAPGNNGRPFQSAQAVDSRGNIYVCGNYGGEVVFNNVSSGAGAGEAYLAKISPTGVPRWIKYLRTGSSRLDGLVVDAAGTVHLAGTYSASPLQLSSTISLPNAGGADLFVARFDSSGNVRSAVRVGGTGNEAAVRLVLDAQGNAYVTGEFSGTVAFGGTTLTSAGDQDGFVARLDANGSWRWAQRAGGLSHDFFTALAVNTRGQVFAAGYVNSPITQVGPFILPPTNQFLVRFDAATGAFQRVLSLGGGSLLNADVARVGDLVTDPAGNCYVGGSFLGIVSFGATTLTNPGRSISLDDVFLAKLDTAAQWQWARVVATGNLGEYCTGLKVDRRGNLYLSGEFRSTPTRIGPFALTPTGTLIDHDVYVAKFDATGQCLWAVPGQGNRSDMCAGLALGPYATPHIGGDSFSSSLLLAPHTVPGTQGAAFTYLARLQPNELDITGDSVLCGGGSTLLTARTFAPGSSISYRWSTGATTPSIRVTQPGTYTATATLAGGYTLSQQFQVRSISPAVQISGNTGPLCPGSPRQLTALAPGALSYQWSTGATTPGISVTQPGTYTVQATYGPACAVTAQATVTANNLTTAGRLQLCPGQGTTLTAVATGSPVTSYQWSTGATTPTLYVNQGGSYTVTARFADGCQLSRTHTVGPPVAKVASVSGDTLLCPGTVLNLTALNPDALTYRWNTGETTPDIRITRPGLYAVLLTYTGGCTSRDSLLVEAAPLAPAFSLGADTTLCLEQPLLLRAPALNGTGLSYRWQDGSTAPTLTVTEPGTYSLQVTSLCDTRTVSRRVAYVSCLQLPTVLTPNGDGLNDRLRFPGLTRGDWELTIYNRWGREVYRTPAYRHDWGPGAAPGVYYYQLRQGSTRYKNHLEVIR